MQTDEQPEWGGNGDAGLAEVTPIRYSVFESTVGDIVARAYKIDPLDHTRDDLLHVMDGVRETLDAKSRMDRIGWHGVGDDSYASRVVRLTEYLRDGCFMSDLHEDDDQCRLCVQMSWDNVLATVSRKTNTSKPSRVFLMEQLDWFRFESAVDSGELLGRALAREIDISPTTLGTLVRLYERAGRVRSRA